jgi:hypothetical protein
MRRIGTSVALTCTFALALAACDQSATVPDATATETVAAIPGSLAPFGDGYPAAGDACRQLSESPATSDWLDDSAVQVGCPTVTTAGTLGGAVVGKVDGVTVVSVPQGDANAGMVEKGAPPPPEREDALVPGTDYNATTTIDCGFKRAAPTARCDAGVKRNRNGPGTAVVEVTKPDGIKRSIFFKGTGAFSADSSQADGSAAYDFKATRKGDETTVRFGPETYVIFDALVVGG